MNFAIIGSAHGHIYEIIDDMLKAGARFVGIFNDGTCDAAVISRKYRAPLFNSLEDLLKLEIDVVGSAAVNSQKMKILQLCSERGIHFFCTKPLIIDEHSLTKLESLLESSRIEVGMMLPMRFFPESAAIKKVLDDQEIGRVVGIEIFNPHKLLADCRPEWFFNKSRSGGIVTDLLIHSIDLFRWLSGSEISWYKGVVGNSRLQEEPGFLDLAQFLVLGESGVSGYFRTDLLMSETHWTWGDLRIFCTGTKGCLEARILGDPISREPEVVLYREGAETARLKYAAAENSSTFDFLSRINKQDHVVKQEDIVIASRLAVEMDKSARPVRVMPGGSAIHREE